MASKNKCIASKINKGMTQSAAMNACGVEPPSVGKKRSSKRRQKRGARRGRDLLK
tara:strand:+ start:99 stop:263 length:165 start_codon:yes stop_codon:yes gene_type:complete